MLNSSEAAILDTDDTWQSKIKVPFEVSPRTDSTIPNLIGPCAVYPAHQPHPTVGLPR